MPTRSLRDRALRRKASAALSANRQTENVYVRQLRGIMAAVHKATLNQIGDTIPTPHELSLITSKIQAALPTAVNTAFTKMSHDVVRRNGTALKAMGVPVGPEVRQQRLVRGGRGDAIGKALAKQLGDPGLAASIDAARQANIALITNAARDYAADVQKVFNDPKNIGLHVKDLTDQLVDRGNVSQSRAELIARDQTLKLNGNITQIRQQAAGISSYTWSTSNDERVREEHRELEGQVFTWDNPPSVGAPGQDIQCRCIAVPIIEGLEEIFGGEPTAPVEETPTEEPTIDLPVEEEVFVEPPPPPPREEVAPVAPPKPEKVKEPKLPKEPKPPKPPVIVLEPVKPLPPPKPVVVEPVVIVPPKPVEVFVPPPLPELEPLPKLEEPKDLTAPPDRGFVKGVHVGTVFNESKIPQPELDHLISNILPDRGHEEFLTKNPLYSLTVQEYLKEDAGGLYFQGGDSIQIKTKVGETFLTELPFRPGKSGGTYDLSTSVEDRRDLVMIHEFGHHIHLTGFEDKYTGITEGSEFQNVDKVVQHAFDESQKRANPEDRAITKYGSTNHYEFFAESYTVWRREPEVLKEHSPMAYAMVEQVLKLRGIR